jgi:hypothetical protein
MLDSHSFFVLLETLHLTLVVLITLVRNNVIFWVAICLTALKFSVSSLQSPDILIYNKVYDQVDKLYGIFEAYEGQEGMFVNLLYLARQLNVSLIALHFFEIILLFMSANFMLNALLPKHQAKIFTLFFGFIAVGGELCLYLLRQLLATSIIFFGIGFVFREKPLKALPFFLGSVIIHTTSIFYFPMFISAFISNQLSLERRRITQLIVMAGLYTLLILPVYDAAFGISMLSSFVAQASLFYLKFDYYANKIDNTDLGRDTSLGLISTMLLGFFISFFVIRFKAILQGNIQKYYFYVFTLFFSGFYIILERLSIYWISSRVNFIAKMLLYLASMLLIHDIFSKNKFRVLIIIVSILTFFVSTLLITQGNEQYGIFNFSI